MGWVRYDDEVNFNRKVVALKAEGRDGIAAFGLHVLLNAHARYQGTGGMIGKREVNVIAGSSVGNRLVKLLVSVGMVDDHGDRWGIHDCQDYGDPNDPAGNISTAEKRRSLAEKRAAAGSKGGSNKASKRLANGEQQGEHHPLQTSTPVPVPVPDRESNQPPPVSAPDPDGGGGGVSFRNQVMLAAAAVLAEKQPAGTITNHAGWITKVARRLLEEHGPKLAGYDDVAQATNYVLHLDAGANTPHPVTAVERDYQHKVSGAGYGRAVAEAQIDNELVDAAAFEAEIADRPQVWRDAALVAYRASVHEVPSNVVELRRQG